jgi:hypothetical protein
MVPTRIPEDAQCQRDSDSLWLRLRCTHFRVVHGPFFLWRSGFIQPGPNRAITPSAHSVVPDAPSTIPPAGASRRSAPPPHLPRYMVALHISVLLPRLRVHCGAVPINAVVQLSVLPLLQRRDARPPPPIPPPRIVALLGATSLWSRQKLPATPVIGNPDDCRRRAHTTPQLPLRLRAEHRVLARQVSHNMCHWHNHTFTHWHKRTFTCRKSAKPTSRPGLSAWPWP